MSTESQVYFHLQNDIPRGHLPGIDRQNLQGKGVIGIGVLGNYFKDSQAVFCGYQINYSLCLI